jgi:pyridoxine kinase
LKQPHILAVSSFAVHGTASLKTFITVLGEKILPVPSLLLNGLTNMSLVTKFEPPFKELLQGTFELAVNRNLELILYIGYLGKAEQADIILEMIGTYREHIKTIITDPVCGDHGRKYVPDTVIVRWPDIIRLSDMVFPNQTELKILTGNAPDVNLETDELIHQFNKLYPETKLIITSIKTEDGAIGIKVAGNEPFIYTHPLLPKNFGGSGDLLLSLFILNHFYKKVHFNEALTIAADQTSRVITASIAQGVDDLILSTINENILS